MPLPSVVLVCPPVRRLLAVLVSALTLIIVLPLRAEAADIAIAWDAPNDAAVAGYIVEYGTTAAPFNFTMNVGNQTVWTFTGAVAGTTYVFRVRAYNSAGILSDPSASVSGLTTASSCVTPDPFAAMGGGTCYNGGWLPPGMPVPGGTTTTTAPAPAPTTPVVSSPSICTTPDPFAGMGGGTCYNGGWLPPGMAVPGGATSPAPAPAPSPTPVAPAPSPTPTSPSTCTTPNPFASMGGGTCYNGGWLPPGMPVPGGSTSPGPAPAPTPAPSPTPVAPSPPPPSTSPSSCTTADPFAGMGGGTCYNGGWLPPGMPVPGGAATSPSPTSAPPPTSSAPAPSSPTGCATPDPFASIPGMLGYCRDGGWVPIPGQNGTIHFGDDGAWKITGEDGVTYSPVEPLDPSFQLDGLRVFFAGVPDVSDNGDAPLQILSIRAG